MNNNTCVDVDECSNNEHNCDEHADCSNTDGGFECICLTGYFGDGRNCYDTNECTGNHTCHESAECINTEGSYDCVCRNGFAGNGTFCEDIIECNTSIHECSIYAECSNNVGSYTCLCNTGYSGNGTTCEDADECLSDDTCHVKATCTNTEGSFTCECHSGYNGDGHECHLPCPDGFDLKNNGAFSSSPMCVHKHSTSMHYHAAFKYCYERAARLPFRNSSTMENTLKEFLSLYGLANFWLSNTKVYNGLWADPYTGVEVSWNPQNYGFINWFIMTYSFFF